MACADGGCKSDDKNCSKTGLRSSRDILRQIKCNWRMRVRMTWWRWRWVGMQVAPTPARRRWWMEERQRWSRIGTRASMGKMSQIGEGKVRKGAMGDDRLRDWGWNPTSGCRYVHESSGGTGWIWIEHHWRAALSWTIYALRRVSASHSIQPQCHPRPSPHHRQCPLGPRHQTFPGLYGSNRRTMQESLSPLLSSAFPAPDLIREVGKPRAEQRADKQVVLQLIKR